MFCGRRKEALVGGKPEDVPGRGTPICSHNEAIEAQQVKDPSRHAADAFEEHAQHKRIS